MLAESFHVKTHVFEGPLELLLDLIEKRKLHINDVSLSQVTDDFISHLSQKEHFPLGLSAHFILVASTLLLIKSKSLLPTLDLTTEEEESIQDLERRLKEYQRIKELSLHVKELFGSRIVFNPERRREPVIVFAPSEGMDKVTLAAAARAVLESFPKKESRPEVRIGTVVTLEETIEKLTERVARALRTSFSEFSGHGAGRPVTHEQKIEVIVGFLAVLELAKRGAIAVRQDAIFDEIHMESEAIGVPRYN